MRHILLPGAITTGTRSVQEPAAKAHLVAPGGGSLCVVSSSTGAVSGAIDVATIATAADRHLRAAAGTDEQPRRDGIVLVAPTGPSMTGAARAAILPRHACPGTVWCTVPKQNRPVGLGRRACHISCGPNTVGASQLNPTPGRCAPAADHPRTSREAKNVARFTRIPTAIDSRDYHHLFAYRRPPRA